MRDEIVPAKPRQTSRQPQVRRDNPGPVFSTTGRFRALLSALVYFAIMVGAYRLYDAGFGSRHLVIFQLGMLLLGISAVWSLGRAVMPSLHLKVNSDGLLVSRMGMVREIPWSQVQRVGVAGTGKRAAVAVWFTDGAAQRSTLWHRLRPHHGGARVFPIGSVSGWLTRRQEIRRVRTALQQYAPGRYDSRVL
ncbi:hypothetical protein ACFFRS_22090 [Saccharopolyspora hordei]